MLIRTSAKFRQQYRCAVEQADPSVRPFPQTWNVDLIRNGPQQLLVLASEEFSLFTILVPTGRARNATSFLEPFRERLLDLFENMRIRSADRPDLDLFTFLGRTDKKIIGSQCDLSYHAQWQLQEAIQPASPGVLRDIERHLNDMPMSYLGMASPLDVLRKKTEWLKGVCGQ